MSVMASQITRVTIAYWDFGSGTDQRKHAELGVTGLCEGDSPVTSEFPAQRASNVENDFIWGRHHGLLVMWQSKGWGNQQAYVIDLLQS